MLQFYLSSLIPVLSAFPARNSKIQSFFFLLEDHQYQQAFGSLSIVVQEDLEARSILCSLGVYCAPVKRIWKKPEGLRTSSKVTILELEGTSESLESNT